MTGTLCYLFLCLRYVCCLALKYLKNSGIRELEKNAFRAVLDGVCSLNFPSPEHRAGGQDLRASRRDMEEKPI